MADLATTRAFYGQALGPLGVQVVAFPNHYAAYVRDPDGNTIEAVCRAV